ncbi:thiamin pyrophosphokinase 1 [Cydia amplana]|uniref:thiamin pyrophosphokinase 1 n=1 Tax=Cydia amplana TaxID=1869771 RepID=UPI002FE5CDD6
MIPKLAVREIACIIGKHFGMALRGVTVNGVHNPCNSQCDPVQCWKWDVSPIIYHTKSVNYAVLVLNTPITQSQTFFTQLWNSAKLRVTVDGGTKKWETFINNCPEEIQKDIKLPDLVTGDFDSISQDDLEKYRKKGCKVAHTPDQNHTDFTKALMELSTHCRETNTDVDHIIAIAQSSRRIDQIFSNVQTLFLAKANQLISPTTRLYLISDDAVSWLLPPGDHVIVVPEESKKHKRAWCSLVPVGEPCVVTSTGLKWNLNNQILAFGKLVSSSNTFTGSDTVTVKCSHPLLWSMKVPSLQSKYT